MTGVVQKIINFCTGQDEKKSQEDLVREDKEARANKSQKEIDKTVEDSFPASDPPARY